MTTALCRMARAVLGRAPTWLLTVLGFVTAYYLGLLLAAVLRFRQIPNYVNLFDWPYNVRRILDGTPSLADVWAIVGDEWILDVGRMNYDYGNGVPEWAMTVITGKLAVIALVGALFATALVLVLHLRRDAVLDAHGRQGSVLAVAGAGLVGLANATLHWAVACATPSWVASLAMLGMSPALANALEPAGAWVTVSGFLLLLLALALLARRRPAPSRYPPAASREHPRHA